jgi:hypothetical protein
MALYTDVYIARASFTVTDVLESMSGIYTGTSIYSAVKKKCTFKKKLVITN